MPTTVDAHVVFRAQEMVHVYLPFSLEVSIAVFPLIDEPLTTLGVRLLSD